MEIKHFNSVETAKILGVNVSIIKRWTDEGGLECLKTAGGHRKFLMIHLGNCIKQNNNDNTKINLFPLEDEADLQVSYYVVKGDFDYLRKYVIEQALASKPEKVQQVLNGLYPSDYPLYEIDDRLIMPVLQRFGEMWVNDELSIIEEHFGSQTIRDSIIRLQGIIKIPTQKIGRAVCLNLSLELHDIALKMVANILEAKGYQVYFSGQYTNIFKIEQAFEKFQPHRLYISSTWFDDVGSAQQELNQILTACDQYDIYVYPGGQAIKHLKIDHRRVKKYLHNFEEAYNS
jgi:methanogenic corrinoid protein MtbC1